MISKQVAGSLEKNWFFLLKFTRSILNLYCCLMKDVKPICRRYNKTFIKFLLGQDAFSQTLLWFSSQVWQNAYCTRTKSINIHCIYLDSLSCWDIDYLHHMFTVSSLVNMLKKSFCGKLHVWYTGTTWQKKTSFTNIHRTRNKEIFPG